MEATKPTAEVNNVKMNSWRNWREVLKIQWKHWENLRHLHQPKKKKKSMKRWITQGTGKAAQKTLLKINYHMQIKYCSDNQIQSRLRYHCSRHSKNI